MQVTNTPSHRTPRPPTVSVEAYQDGNRKHLSTTNSDDFNILFAMFPTIGRDMITDIYAALDCHRVCVSISLLIGLILTF